MKFQQAGSTYEETGNKLIVGAGITLSQRQGQGDGTDGLPQLDVTSSSITVKEQDGTPSFLADTIAFDESTFTVTQNGSTAEVAVSNSAFVLIDQVNTGQIGLQDSLSTDILLYAQVTGDSFSRFRLYADGKMEWGSGGSAPDVNLYRSAANALKTDDTLYVNAINVGGQTLNNVTGADANIVTGTAGTNGNLVKWDASGDAVDTTLVAANVIQSGDLGAAAYLGVTGGASNVVTGASGVLGNLLEYDASGNAIDSGVASSAFLTNTGPQTVDYLWTFDAGLKTNDDDPIKLGTGEDYWVWYHQSSTQFEIYSAGEATAVLSIDDGSTQVDFVGNTKVMGSGIFEGNIAVSGYVTAGPGALAGFAPTFFNHDFLTEATSGTPTNIGGLLSYIEQTVSTGGGPQALEAYTLMSHSTGAVALALASVGNVELNSAGTVTEAHSFHGGVGTGDSATGTITDAVVFYAANGFNTGSGSTTTYYGLYVDTLTSGGTNWAIYVENNDSYFNGDITVTGTATVGGNTVLTTADEGSGNGLDADTLDTYDAIDFPRKAENAVITGFWDFSQQIQMLDDADISLGTGFDYWFIYDVGNTRFEFNSTDIDGVGTNGILFYVDDGTDDVNFFGDISVSGSISASNVTGIDANFVTGTAGTNGNIAEWDSNGDLVDGGVAASSFLTESSAPTLTGLWSFNSDIRLGDTRILYFGNVTSPYFMRYTQSDFEFGTPSSGEIFNVPDNTNNINFGGHGDFAGSLGVTGDLTINYSGTDLFAEVIGPLNRTLRFVLQDNTDEDAFEWHNQAGLMMSLPRTGELKVGDSSGDMVMVGDQGVFEWSGWHTAAILASNVYYTGSNAVDDEVNWRYIGGSGTSSIGGSAIYARANNDTARGIYGFSFPISSGVGGTPGSMPELFSFTPQGLRWGGTTAARITSSDDLVDATADETITGLWTFVGTGTTVIMRLYSDTATTDARAWDIRNNTTTGDLEFRAVTDAGSTQVHAFSIDRDGTVDFNYDLDLADGADINLLNAWTKLDFGGASWTTGGRSRGHDFYDGTTRVGSVGMFGDAGTVQHLYLSAMDTPYSNYGIRINQGTRDILVGGDISLLANQGISLQGTNASMGILFNITDASNTRLITFQSGSVSFGYLAAYPSTDTIDFEGISAVQVSGNDLLTETSSPTLPNTWTFSNGTEGIYISNGASRIGMDSKTSGQPLKSITWNDGGGNFNIAVGRYYSGGNKYVGATTGAALQVMNGDSSAGWFKWYTAVANTGSAGDPISWSNTLELTTSSFNINSNEILHEASTPTLSNNWTFNGRVDIDNLLDLRHTTSNTTNWAANFYGEHTHNQPMTAQGVASWGFYTTIAHSSGTIPDVYGVDVAVQITDAGDATNVVGFEVWGGINAGGGTVSTWKQIYIDGPYDSSTVGSITTAIGLDIANITGGLTGNFAIRTGTGNVSFGDQIKWGGGSYISSSNDVLNTASSPTLTDVWTFQDYVRITATGEVTLASTSHAFQIGPSTGFHLDMDGDEIQAASGTVAQTLGLNPHGGNVYIGEATNCELDLNGDLDFQGQQDIKVSASTAMRLDGSSIKVFDHIYASTHQDLGSTGFDFGNAYFSGVIYDTQYSNYYYQPMIFSGTSPTGSAKTGALWIEI